MTTQISIFNIQHFSLHDGPGTRTTIFFKGCPLSCHWCSNPESQSQAVELLYDQKLCQGCGACVAVCPAQALSLGEGGVERRRELCRSCLTCAAACPSRALHTTGQLLSVEQLLAEAERDAVFYRRSGGGVTLSGGEPLLQAAGAAQLLQACRSHNISTCIETSCFAPWASLELVWPYLDHWFCDIKLTDSEKHRRFTGQGNELILANIKELLRRKTSMTLRYPLIPGLNDSAAELTALASWLLEQDPGQPLELLAYHRFGTAKYAMLGRGYTLEELRPQDQEELRAKDGFLRRLGVNCINDK